MKKSQNCEIKSRNNLFLFFIQWRKRVWKLPYFWAHNFCKSKITHPILSSLWPIYIYIYIYMRNMYCVTNPSHEHCSTHHQRSLSHHWTFHTVTDHSRTTFPIIHCTNTAVCTDHAHTCIQSPNHHHPITHTT